MKNVATLTVPIVTKSNPKFKLLLLLPLLLGLPSPLFASDSTSGYKKCIVALPWMQV